MVDGLVLHFFGFSVAHRNDAAYLVKLAPADPQMDCY